MTLTTIANSAVDRPAASPRPLAAPPVPARTKMLLEAPIGPCATAGRYRRAPQCDPHCRRDGVSADIDIRAGQLLGDARTAAAVERNRYGRRIQLRHDLGGLLYQFRATQGNGARPVVLRGVCMESETNGGKDGFLGG
jgi:hypothetical protein